MALNTNELAQCLEVVATKLRKLPTEIELDRDYYWVIDEAELYNPLADPKTANMTLGQLTFDWDSLRTLNQDPDSFVPQSLRWLGTILVALSQEDAVVHRLLK